MKPSRNEVALEGLLELPGSPEKWIWAFTCPTPGCDCRTAIVLTTDGGRDALLTQGAPVRDAWLGHSGYAKATVGLEHVDTFAIDLDDGSVSAAYFTEPSMELDWDPPTAVRDTAERMDGEVLDAVARLWYRGKGWDDPEEKSRELREIKVENWRPGETVAWGEAFVGLREDMYRFGDRVFEAVEQFCVSKGCSCGEVVVDFQPVVPPGAPAPGAVRVDRAGAVTFEPTHERHRERLEQLWTAFRKRHPRHVERFARRAAIMSDLGGRIVGAPRGAVERSGPKIGRNDPCPCGSGKKYKKCCGAA